MMGFDLGGPVNKVAYAFGAGRPLASGNAQDHGRRHGRRHDPAARRWPWPPCVRKHLFTEAEREAGEAAWLLGASFITEGAIPFAAADPLRVIPATMVGSAVTGGLVMGFGNELPGPARRHLGDRR